MTDRNNATVSLPKSDRYLMVGGFVATLLAIYLTYTLLNGHWILLLLEVAAYAAVITVYILTFRNPQNQFLILLSRVLGYASIIAAILIAAFVVYFLMTFSW